MTRVQLINILRTGSGVVLGVAAHHYGGQILDRKNIMSEAAAQEIRDKKLETIDQKLNSVKSLLEDSLKKAENNNENSTISTDMGNQVKDKINEIVETVQSYKNIPVDVNSTNDVDQIISKVEKASKDINKVIENWSNGNNNFISDFNIQILYDYLDSLSLLE